MAAYGARIDRTELDRDGMMTVLVPVSTEADAPTVCTDLVAEGVQNIELMQPREPRPSQGEHP